MVSLIPLQYFGKSEGPADFHRPSEAGSSTDGSRALAAAAVGDSASSQSLPTNRAPVVPSDCRDASQRIGATITDGGSSVRPIAANSLRDASCTKSVSAAPPGISEFTVTPVSLSSCAQISVSASIAALVTP